MRHIIPQTFLALALIARCTALTVNADFSRDIAAGTNPGPNPASVVYSGTGPSADSGTLWNELKIPLSATGDLGADTITHPIQFIDLTDSGGFATTIDIQLTSGFQRSFNSTATSSTAVTSLQNDRVFSSGGATATMKVQGLDPAKRYDLFLIGSSTFSTTFTVNSVSKFVVSPTYDGSWTEGGEYASFTDIAPTAGGEITITIQDTAATGFGVISGMQIATTRTSLIYPDSVATTGGQFTASYPPLNLFNGNGTNDSNGPFSSPSNLVNTTVNYLASSTNYASSTTTSTPNFDLTFDFNSATDLNGMHVWNYTFRNGAANTTYNNGVNAYTLTFYNGPNATGSTIGSVFSSTLLKAQASALNSAQTVYFPSTYAGVRSVKMRVVSNFGVASFTGMCELAFNRPAVDPSSPAIVSLATSAPFVQKPAQATLSWTVTGAITSLSISPGLGDVLPLTTAGSGSIPVSPIGDTTYTLTLNGSITRTVKVIGLPAKEKLHLYLLIGQSNMQGVGGTYDNSLDAPVPRVLKFGSREGLESSWVTGGHPLTSLTTSASGNIGMGLEFGKSMLAAQSDPEVVIGLINHALGSTAIEWWAPGAPHTKATRASTSQPYYLYDEAVARVAEASQYGILKGVLWHQGEFNSGTNTDPDSDPNGYAARLQTLVSNLRNSFGNPFLPFVCGKFVPASWTDANGTAQTFTGLPYRAIVEGALMDLPNQRTNTFGVDNNGLRGNNSDKIHFDAYSQRLLGQRYANAMLGFYADPYRLYLGGFLTPAELADAQVTDPRGDIDHDGISNFLEYAFLTNPKQPQSIQPVSYSSVKVPGEGNFPAISFRQRSDAEAPQYVVQVSNDLTKWTGNLDSPTAVTEVVGSPVANGDGTFTTTVRVLAPPVPCFLRVRASRN